MKYLFTLLIVLLATSAWAWTLTSDPSPQNATLWKVELQSGETYQGDTTSDFRMAWDIDPLDPGVYQGDAYFGYSEWALDAEGSKTYAGTVWSNSSTPFVLERRGGSTLSSTSNLDIGE